MGNSSSQWLHHQQHQHVATADPVGWAHSYPRERGRQGLTKVLPEREPGRRLRLTDNGAILSGGGTISGRREQHIDDRPRVRSTSVHAVPGSTSSSSLGGKRFGSEPDLRASATGREHSSRPRINHNRGRKKYKAPAPPPGGEAASSSPDSGRWEEVPAAARRLRLFKTRAETRRSVGIPRTTAPEPASHPPLMRSLSSPEFQAELVRAVQRLRPLASRQREAPVGESSPRPVPLPSRKEAPPPTRSVPEKQHWEILPPASSDGKERDVPAKTFYFGMEQEHEAVDRFAASLQRVPPPLHGRPRRGGSLSSSEGADSEAEEDLVKDIALQLRPTLPKKTPEIPRFSPTAAWRLLSALDQAPSSTPSTADDASVLLEERIQRLSRPVAPPVPQAPRSKSGDSGISGDASPGGLPEDSVRKSPPQLVAWTPQQDLEGEEESSSDGGGGGGGGTPHLPKFSPRAHVFSLSLPRDDRLCLALYSDSDDLTRLRRETQPPFNSLQKLKKSVSGAIGVALGSTIRRDEDKGQPLDENWLLSRSVPNSLNNGHLLEPWGGCGGDIPSSPSSGPDQQDKQLPFSYLATGGHVMYLPQYQDQAPQRRRSGLWDAAPLSKSCENVSEMRQVRRTPSPERMAATPTTPEVPAARKGKARRFTFQSTVRQIERRKLAERLSREAEMREKQRLGELEAMRQVEEEFQRKRAREKANIRQQLRLFSLDENLYSSLPTGWGDGARAEPDGAPASSPASSPTSSAGNGGKPAASRQASGSSDLKAPGTQVLSEFREPRREYRDYRPSSRYIDSAHESLPYMESKRATVHPQVVYDIPKNTQVYVSPHHQINGITSNGFHNEEKGGISTPKSSNSDNYRRDFAHGTRPTGCSLASSDSELSQSNNLRPLSRQGRSQLIHHQRSRSSSPEMCTEMNPETESLDGKHTQSEEHENYTSLPPGQLTTSPSERFHRLSFTSIQPFVRNGKGYRPIVFNPGTSSSHKVAQTVS